MRTSRSLFRRAASKDFILTGSLLSFNASAAMRRKKLVSWLGPLAGGSAVTLALETGAGILPRAISNQANSVRVEGFQPMVRKAPAVAMRTAASGSFRQAARASAE